MSIGVLVCLSVFLSVYVLISMHVYVYKCVCGSYTCVGVGVCVCLSGVADKPAIRAINNKLQAKQ